MTRNLGSVVDAMLGAATLDCDTFARPRAASKRRGEGTPTGRPPIKIDAEFVERVAALFCTMQEIAETVGCSVATLERRFAGSIKKGREKGKANLRRHQFLAAQKGNPTMLIWLGKQHLGQTDKLLPLAPLTDDELRRIIAGAAAGERGRGVR
ncbi:MAG: hypothetical protein ACSLFQ_10120 [Thermoanaerobaculia bacterium]